MKPTYLIICIIVSLITSCSSPQSETTKLNLSGGKNVIIDSIATPCILAPAAMAIIGNELFIANFRQDTVFSVFEIPSLKFLRTGGIVGVGPEEIAGGSLALSTKKYQYKFLSMNDVTGLGVNIIAPDELTTIGHKALFIPQYWGYIQNHLFLRDGRQLLQRGQLPMDWGIANSDYEIETAFEMELPDDVTAWANDDLKNMFAHTSHCAASLDHNSIAIIASCLPLIEIYDFQGHKKRRITGDYTLGEQISKTAIYVQSTDDFIYVNYHDPTDTGNNRSTISVFDWEGNQVETYQIGILVTTFAVDEVNKKIYFCTGGDNDNLFWFDI